jgi:hypothetical protein
VSEEGGSELDSETADELDVSESDSEMDDDCTSAESDEDYGEWTGFDQGSEADGGPAPPPIKWQETITATATPQPGSKYVPPHLRKVIEDGQSQSSESQVKLTKQLKGHLNR